MLGIYSVAADISVRPGVDSASKNEYQDIPGGKGGRCVRVTTLPPSCADCLVIWSLNRPEPSGPHWPVIGIALHFYYIILYFIYYNFFLSQRSLLYSKFVYTGNMSFPVLNVRRERSSGPKILTQGYVHILFLCK